MEQEQEQKPKDPEKTFTSILKDAARIAEQFGLQSYSTFHILLSIFRRDAFLREWLTGKGVEFNQLLAEPAAADGFEPSLGELLSRVRALATTAAQPRKPIHLMYGMLSFGSGGSGYGALANIVNPMALQEEIVAKRWLRNPPGEEPAEEETEKRGLAKYGIDFTKLAREGKLHNVVDRDEEIDSIIQVLARKDMEGDYDEAINNPVLIGPAGTGKTALAKALAVLIAQRDPRVQFMWNNRLIYLKLGTLQAGTGIRGTLEAKIEEILEDCKSEPTILFLDELHVVMGLGKTEGSPGIEEVLKPILAEGLSCIGATTTEEWRREIESKNTAFAERWIPVVIEQPNEEKTLRIVRSAVNDIARRHVVYFPDEVLVSAVSLGRRYIPYEASPRREIEKILNGVGAQAKIERRSSATVEDVLRVIERITGIPVGTQQEQQSRLVDAEADLNRIIFGQGEVTRELARAMQRYFSGMRDANKPLVALLLGPTGSGKTFSVKTVAKKYLFDRMLRIDMSEFMEKHSMSRLISAPPGYVGYDQPGQLTEGIRRMGEGAVLLDEIEKAHPDIFQLFLGLFDEGRLTDGKGNTVDGRNCIFFLSSNIGSHLFSPATSTRRTIGFGAGPAETPDDSFETIKARVIEEAKRRFSPELWNRIDLKLVYSPHNAESLRKIAVSLLEEEREKCRKQQGIEISWSPEVLEHIVSHGFDPANGARPMKRVIMNDIQNLLAQPILSRAIARGDRIALSIGGGTVNWTKQT